MFTGKRLKKVASYHIRNILHTTIPLTDFNRDFSVAFTRKLLSSTNLMTSSFQLLMVSSLQPWKCPQFQGLFLSHAAVDHHCSCVCQMFVIIQVLIISFHLSCVIGLLPVPLLVYDFIFCISDLNYTWILPWHLSTQMHLYIL